jgi:hypothetical protein
MAGYSGTPLAQKLGVRAGVRVCVRGAPLEVREVLHDVLGARVPLDRRQGGIDFGMLFAADSGRLTRGLALLERRLAPDGMLWLCWPKKSSGVATDLSEAAVRREGLATGLVDVKVCAVTEIWSGLKFMRRRVDRP